MDPLTALFVSLACKDLPLVEYAVEFTVLDRGKLPPPPRPPRHHWTEQEGSYHPVSGERLSQIQSSARPIAQPTITPMCGAQARAPTTDKPSKHGATELRIATELEWFMTSDQVRELATMPATRETAVDSESAERSSAHCTMAGGPGTESLWMYMPTCPLSSLFRQSPLSVLSPRQAQRGCYSHVWLREGHSSRVKPGNGSYFHLQPRKRLCSRAQAREGFCPWVQPRGGFRSQVRPGEGFWSREWPKEGSCSWVRPREGFRSQVRPREGFCSHVRPKEDFRSWVWPREGFRYQDRPREGFCYRV